MVSSIHSCENSSLINTGVSASSQVIIHSQLSKIAREGFERIKTWSMTTKTIYAFASTHEIKLVVIADDQLFFLNSESIRGIPPEVLERGCAREYLANSGIKINPSGHGFSATVYQKGKGGEHDFLVLCISITSLIGLGVYCFYRYMTLKEGNRCKTRRREIQIEIEREKTKQIKEDRTADIEVARIEADMYRYIAGVGVDGAGVGVDGAGVGVDGAGVGVDGVGVDGVGVDGAGVGVGVGGNGLAQ